MNIIIPINIKIALLILLFVIALIGISYAIYAFKRHGTEKIKNDRNKQRKKERSEKLREFEISQEDRAFLRKMSIVRRVELNKRFAERGVMSYIQDHDCLRLPEYYKVPRPAHVCYDSMIRMKNVQAKLKIVYSLKQEVRVSIGLNERTYLDWDSSIESIEKYLQSL